jgi:hypothetical protein
MNLSHCAWPCVNRVTLRVRKSSVMLGRVVDERSRSSALVRNSFKSRRVQRSTPHSPSWSDRKAGVPIVSTDGYLSVGAIRSRHSRRGTRSRRSTIGAHMRHGWPPSELQSGPAHIARSACTLCGFSRAKSPQWRQDPIDRNIAIQQAAALVCARPLRPGRNGAEQSNEFAPSHCPSGRHLRRSCA